MFESLKVLEGHMTDKYKVKNSYTMHSFNLQNKRRPKFRPKYISLDFHDLPAFKQTTFLHEAPRSHHSFLIALLTLVTRIFDECVGPGVRRYKILRQYFFRNNNSESETGFLRRNLSRRAGPWRTNSKPGWGSQTAHLPIGYLYQEL
jgi:hypothetical protein